MHINLPVLCHYVSPLYRWRHIALPITAQLFVGSVLCLCVLPVYRAGGQTRDADPMPGYCLYTLYNAEPTLAQYWRANIDPAFVFYLNRPKSLKNKQKTENRHTDTLECGYPTSFSAD